MILTGKAKDDFLDKYRISENWFNSMLQIYQNALIIEFFDSVGIRIEINHQMHPDVGLSVTANLYYHLEGVDYYEDYISTSSRIEAQNEGIIRARNKYNNQRK